MSIVMGNKRISEDAYSIVSSDGVTMTSTIEGISALSDLQNKIIWLVSPVAGGANSTININNLGAVSVVYDLSSETITTDWCKANVPFPVSLYIDSGSNKQFFIVCK